MMHNLCTIQVFSSSEFGKIRVTISNHGEPMFCLADICNALDLSNPRQVKRRLNPKGIAQYDLATVTNDDGVSINLLGNSMANFINEANLYKCIFQSRKPEAEKFQDWVCEEVLPTIRKYGLYATSETIEAMLANPDTLIQLLTKYKEERRLREEADAIIQENLPRIRLAQAIEASGTDCYIGDLAKILAQNGVNIGEKRLFDYLRNNGYIGRTGAYRNVANQKYIEMGLFKLVESSYNNGTQTFTNIRTFVTGKGRAYFIKKFIGTYGDAPRLI